MRREKHKHTCWWKTTKKGEQFDWRSLSGNNWEMFVTQNTLTFKNQSVYVWSNALFSLSRRLPQWPVGDQTWWWVCRISCCFPAQSQTRHHCWNPSLSFSRWLASFSSHHSLRHLSPSCVASFKLKLFSVEKKKPHSVIQTTWKLNCQRNKGCGKDQTKACWIKLLTC